MRVAVALATFAFGACSSQPPPSPSGTCIPACAKTERCEQGNCVTTVLECTPACASGERCEGGTCVPVDCEPPCGKDEQCRAGACVANPPPECNPTCQVAMHCERGACVPNLCAPACGAGEVCLEHAADACRCGTNPRCPAERSCVDGQCRAACEDGLDDDSDGWTDQDDPDCSTGTGERGFGDGACNDGLDNDEDARTDALDPQCAEPTSDELLGSSACQDVCLLDDARGGRTCRLWDSQEHRWIAPEDGAGHMHNRARRYDSYLRRFMLPAGGVSSILFTDTTYTQRAHFGDVGDSAIWTGTFLAAESWRYLATRSPDALAQVEATVRTLHDWFGVSGDPGYLARFAAPADSPSDVLALISPADRKSVLGTPYQGKAWNWIGDPSRDQYQGPLLGYSLAYQALSDPTLKEAIRSDVVGLVEQLIKKERRNVAVTVDGFSFPANLELQYCVFTDDETEDGKPQLVIDTSDLSEINVHGMQEFHPNPSEILRQISMLSRVPDLPRHGSAMMLLSFLRVALQVTEGVPAYDSRRQAIAAFYEAHASEWLDLAQEWSYSGDCGSGYYAINIVFEPMYNLARLETDPARGERIRGEVLRGRMWSAVADHKNVFFAYVHASQPPSGLDVGGIVASHNAQLDLFPSAPRAHLAHDNTAKYPASSSCEGLSSVAIDVNDRTVDDFMWQRHPWKLKRDGDPTNTYPGVDYLAAYWLGRYHGFLEDDAAGTCLQWR